MKKEMKPILCNEQVVRNILAGRQTQDRRPVRLPEGYTDVRYDDVLCDWLAVRKEFPKFLVITPPSQVGDILYVRETFMSPQKWFAAYRADGQCGGFMDNGDGGTFFNHHGRLQGYSAKQGRYEGILKWGGKWCSSIHMPKWAARIFLKVTEVKAERIRNISREDCVAGGMDLTAEKQCCNGYMCGCQGYPINSVDEQFYHLWNSLYPGSWERNDWVWVRTFKRIEQ